MRTIIRRDLYLNSLTLRQLLNIDLVLNILTIHRNLYHNDGHDNILLNNLNLTDNHLNVFLRIQHED